MKKRIAFLLSFVLMLTPMQVMGAQEAEISEEIIDASFVEAESPDLSGAGAETVESTEATAFDIVNTAEESVDSDLSVQGPRKDKNGRVVWDCLWFGHYVQNDTNKDGKADDSDAVSPIKWRVLTVSDNLALLVTDKGIDSVQYNEKYVADLTWNTSSIRSWLNGYDASENQPGVSYVKNNFYDKAFSDNEKKAIRSWEWSGDKEDKVSLMPYGWMDEDHGFLSDIQTYHDVSEDYDMDMARMCFNTDYAHAKVKYDYFNKEYFKKNHFSWYWLREEQCSKERVESVRYDAKYMNRDVADNYIVRPAILADLSTGVLSEAGTVCSDGSQKEVAYKGESREEVSEPRYITQAKGESIIVGDTAILKLDGVDNSKVYAKGAAGTCENGVITAVKKGTIKLYAPVEGKTKDSVVCIIKAEQPVLKKLSVSLKSGKTKKLKLSGTKTPAQWSSSDEEVCYVGPTGIVSAFECGQATVKAKIRGHVYECQVTVKGSDGVANASKIAGAGFSLSSLHANRAASGEEDVTGDLSGSWGSNIKYSYNSSTKVLTISGSGRFEPGNGSDDFPYKDEVKEVVVKKGITYLGESIFEGWGFENISLPDGLTGIYKSAFKDCKNLKKLVIPDTVKGSELEEHALDGCTSLSELVLGLHTVKIKMHTLANLPSLKTLELPYSVTTVVINSCHDSGFERIVWSRRLDHIGARSFMNCKNLTELAFPDRLKDIEYSAFEGCENLTTIKIPKKQFKKIGHNAFDGTKLKDVYYAGSEKEWNDIVIEDDNEVLKNATMHFNAKYTFETTDNRPGTPAAATNDDAETSSSKKESTILKAVSVSQDSAKLADNGEVIMPSDGSDGIITVIKGKKFKLKGSDFVSENPDFVTVNATGSVKAKKDTTSKAAALITFKDESGNPRELLVRSVIPGVMGVNTVSENCVISATRNLATLSLKYGSTYDLTLLGAGDISFDISAVKNNGPLESVNVVKNKDGKYHLKGRALAKGTAVVPIVTGGKKIKLKIKVTK